MRDLCLVGIGKIARDQHVPTLRASPDFRLAATVSREGTVEGVESFRDFGAFLEARPGVGVVSLCLPPQPRFAYAEAALRAGRHVMLEKPPGQTLAEVHRLSALAAERGLTLFATWHSRMAGGVAGARDWLKGRKVRGGTITWREDVRHWHPGQDWVWASGGMGVFDPGINALSILTAILPEPCHLLSATLEVPSDRQTPIAARLTLSNGVLCDFDWRQEGPQTWDIALDTDGGTLTLREGGGKLLVGDEERPSDPTGEYPGLYKRLAELLGKGESDVDLAPMVLVEDALSLGERRATDAFAW